MRVCMKTYPHFIADKLSGQTVHIVASGPSLKGFDYLKLKDKLCIAVNNSYKKVPWALWTVAGDEGFIDYEQPNAAKETNLITPFCRPGTIVAEGLTYFSLNPHDGLYHRKLSGVMAVTSAIHAGAKTIYLWGHDCTTHNGVIHGTDGEFNHRANSIMPEKLNVSLGFRARLYEAFLQAPVKIFNVSAISAIEYFDRVTPEQAIAENLDFT